ncbi:hypothetical protein SanaruYs_03810 [Chryseotalea sanaruensis]|uniref:Uncharacterized protein n=1 Tax=Chryseotalea sanaruensis TaxID=2482724 RepID=A0A401U5V3_9BACT|nr:Lrp/AsnC family transcriptional regulator [Chryseotalea sanaruensis]GCC50166.1 hypothetical protein SanaruYs_03810 [Chryseotalea sanaruensis]
MGLLKYLDRIERIHKLIEKESTGSASDFSKKLGISRSVLMEHIREMREELNAPISFSRLRETFYYEKSFSLKILISSDLKKIKGGSGNMDFESLLRLKLQGEAYLPVT